MITVYARPTPAGLEIVDEYGAVVPGLPLFASRSDASEGCYEENYHLSRKPYTTPAVAPESMAGGR